MRFERGGLNVDVENVTALLCGRCGMRSVSGKAAFKIGEAIGRVFRTGRDLDMTGIFLHKLAG